MTNFKGFFFIYILFSFQLLHAQIPDPPTFGEPNLGEFTLKEYSLDPEASGVILYERGNYTVQIINGYIKLVKEVHRKIKVLDATKFKHATVEIPYYSDGNFQEHITEIKALTHNDQLKNYISDNAIVNVEDPRWSVKKLTFPDVQDGSILEYFYRIESPYFSNLGTWNFMHELPTVYSEIHTEIPGNIKYNRAITGNYKLFVNHSTIIKDCFEIRRIGVAADCESATYAMINIPAFKEEEYMLAGSNYKPAIKYELMETTKLDNSITKFSNTWKDVDQKFKSNKAIGSELKHTNYFKEQLPSSLLSIPDKLERAKAVYYFIQQQMVWNGKTKLFSDIRVKDAYERKSGNSSEVNLALINALDAANIKSYIMLITTRNLALPSKKFPVLSEFNYAIVFLKINNETYILDATDKNTPFGVLPFRDLNTIGRVMDFKNGSYWEPTTPTSKNMHYINMKLSTNKTGVFSGRANEVSTGYISVKKRSENNGFKLEEKIKRKQSKNENLDITTLSIENENDLEKPYKESYGITLHDQPVANRLFLYPFMMETYFSKNPFLNNTREYPIDFGFPLNNNYLISIDVKDQYKIVRVPENKIIHLPKNDGELMVIYDVLESTVNIRLSVKLNNHSFPIEAYTSLQEFFTELIKIQQNEPIELKKV